MIIQIALGIILAGIILYSVGFVIALIISLFE